MKSHFVYADNAATTRLSEPVLQAMLPYLKDHYGNPSSIYSLGREAKRAVEKAREQVAKALGALPAEVFFTGSGTEADNWALRGVLKMLAAEGKSHIITTTIEHHAVLRTCEDLEEEGFSITYLPVNRQGFIEVTALKAAIREDTALVSIIYANNEIGTIQPIAEIGQICREQGVLFHTDAVQAVGNLPIDVVRQNIDLLALSGHKIQAPKGVGALYIRQGLRLGNLISGGSQERNRRAGTENVPGIVALGKAIELANQNLPAKEAHLLTLRERLLTGLADLSQVQLNGTAKPYLAGIINISVSGLAGESLLLQLDMAGIAASSGSACSSGAIEPSHVLLALGLSHEEAASALRFSFGTENTLAEVDYIVAELRRIISYLRG